MARPPYHSISNIVATVYCERQAVLDREFGRARTADVERKAEHGTAAHRRFELEGKMQRTVDRRCFIATAIYGADAPQTNALRAWRDRALMPSRAGRWLVAGYYRLSPLAVRLVERWPGLATWVRHGLDGLLRRIGRRP